MPARIVCLAFAALVSTSEPAGAEQAPTRLESSVSEPIREFRAHRISGAAPRIDGRLDDDVWARASPVEGLVQEDPDNMAPSSERTGLRVAYDDRFLYVAVEMFMGDMSRLMTGLGRRGNAPPSDRVLLGFDAAHDHQNAYIFEVNASGVQNDWLMVDDTRSNFDYEAVWEVATAILADRWTAEFRIPFSQLRFPAFEERTVWGFNLRREIKYRGEQAWWVARPRGTQGLVSRYGHLVFDESLSPARRLEVSPFVLGRSELRTDLPSKELFSGGVDLRLGLGTSATLSATLNPDFGQVEVDPAVLNLSVFETFFPEKRPFFLEDSRIFTLTSFGQFPDFYSRRIGQRPGRFSLQEGDRLISQPDETTIIGAAKLTGRQGLWTYGGLTALTAREYATVDTVTTDAAGQDTTTRSERLLEPLTMYSVGRVQRDVLGGSSTVGALVTSVVRDGDADTLTAGADTNIRWNLNQYTWNAHWVTTRAPIGGLIRQDHGGSTNFVYSGKHLGYTGHFDHFGRNFRNTDLGFLTSRTDKNEVNGALNLFRPDPGRVIRYVGTFLSSGRQWNSKGLMFGGWVSGGGNMTFGNYWSLYADTGYSFARYDDLDTRGGPPIRRPANNSVSAGFNSDSRKSWNLNVNGSYSWSRVGDRNVFLGVNLRLQPLSRLATSIGVNHTAGRDIAQWISNADADGDGVTDHIYGRLSRDVVNITGRATYAFTRDVTLEAFLQPFVAVGDYTDIRKLARARSFEFSPVSLVDNPDFNRKSLRGTVVLRWEYVRGSTLFAVWNMSGADLDRPGVFSPWRDLGDALSASGTNAFAMKITYWFAP